MRGLSKFLFLTSPRPLASYATKSHIRLNTRKAPSSSCLRLVLLASTASTMRPARRPWPSSVPSTSTVPTASVPRNCLWLRLFWEEKGRKSRRGTWILKLGSLPTSLLRDVSKMQSSLAALPYHLQCLLLTNRMKVWSWSDCLPPKNKP